MRRKDYPLNAVRRRTSGRGGSPVVSRPARRGAAAVEFAFVAPVIFLFLFAAIEFGRVLMVADGLETAAREGCRRAIERGATQQDVENTVADRLGPFGVSDYALTVEPSPPSSACQWEPITVRIAVTYDNVSWLPVPRYLKTIVLTGSSTLPQESDQCGS